ncbi:PREDICTED: uncharacterized protein LOC105565225 [Vollenhovia emeryi]|uniref:uncharacterized protein LOC105565225 n=1 Tax=Vollenhovia emeryi TaxID=411798 RepID=UPI0005F4DA37|nr:PREDICTED: uncharacterized protein LOC105565225 [Vollenhovia emeryi]XP_011873628.1 PREDICTED: uncharacterized protein LOC105565225 [Vollenhovia emeryi]XP_011873629.1 PREDICTED: uncharacterized protein LOC105565225 [Vollenhovia emeryi]
MVVRCLLCKTTYQKERDIQMHKVPKKKEIMKVWLSILNMEQINPNAKLCSKHFTEEDFTISVTGGRKYLKPNAIPSLNLYPKTKKVTGCSSSGIKGKNVQDTYDISHTSLKRSLSMEQLLEEVPVTNIKIIYDTDSQQVSQLPLETEALLHLNSPLKAEEITDCSSSKEQSIQNTQHCNVTHASLKRSLSMEHSLEEVPLKNLITIYDIDVKKVSQSPLEAEACLEVLFEELHAKKKEVKFLNNKICKLQKTVKDLSSLIDTLQDKLINDHS